ncbi:nitrogenase cofactor biosynthesis protein NifB [Oscillospiraceae bacterium WX1]
MRENLVNLNVNPCKMCMPMGAVSALSGLKNCMTILHGSQGCATYIRRHMATHYNEPVDIASSSLTEHGTVFGGEENLLRGLENLVTLYHPEIIGVATTCLAETIGEDVAAIIAKYEAAHPEQAAKIINISSAGYGGTQAEGFFRALRAVVAQTAMDASPHRGINVVTPMLSPADCRYLKSLLDQTGLSNTLLPDLSDTLDGALSPDGQKQPSGGTPLEDIERMAGARHTIELSLFVDPQDSPAEYLFDTYAVPFTRLALPVGLRDTDALVEALVSLGGLKPPTLEKERGRLLDAMVDAHKYCAEGRAAVFGEPDFVYSVTRFCAEIGLVPRLAATGSVSPALRERLQEALDAAAAWLHLSPGEVIDDADFDTIENKALALGVNLLLGSSDARRLAQKHHIGLVRCAFPIHDRLGGQRVRTLGYDGATALLDQASNILLGDKDENFRADIYNRHFSKDAPEIKVQAAPALKSKTHPCFNGCAGKYARMHLPVAPKCNIQCNYCVRKFDCPNESRPGVTTAVLSPEEAIEKFRRVKKEVQNLTVVGIAGPGDALANFEETKKTLQLIRAEDPDITFCISTNGLMLPQYAQELVDLGVSHVTVTINAVDPMIGAQIYHHVDYMGTRYDGVAGAAILLANQLSGIALLVSKGIIVKANTVLLKGINDNHIGAVVQKLKELGADLSNLMQLIPVKGSAFENIGLVSNKALMALRKTYEPDIRQMYHCRHCRADAIGTLENDRSLEFSPCQAEAAAPEPASKKKVAVVSKSGLLVDQHFGHAEELYIYESDGKTAAFLEKRPVSKYCDGGDTCDGDGKINSILSAVSDCTAIIALRIGNAPSQKLSQMGIAVHATYDRIEDAVKKAASE